MGLRRLSMPGPATLPSLLRCAEEAHADRVAVEVDGGDALTYGSWDRRSDAQARGLLRAGVRPGDRVALCFDQARWTEYAVAYLAVHKAAAVAVPLGVRLTGSELQRILADCGASLLVTADPALREGSVPTVDLAELEDPGDETQLSSQVDGSTVAEVLYLSSPLCLPLAVPRSQRALMACPPLAAAGSLLHAFEVGTVAGQDVLLGALKPTTVRSVVLPSFDPDRLCALLSTGQIRACALHPATAGAVLDSGAAGRHDLSRVTALALASGRVPPALLQRLTAAFPQAALLLIDVLGSPPRVRTVLTHGGHRPGALGRPSEGTVVRLTDGAGTPAGAGEVGWLSVDDGQDRGEGGVPTGDLGYLDEEGFLYPFAAHEDPQPGPPDGATGHAEVAVSQEGMLWQECFASGSQNLPGLARRFRGPLDIPALRRALDEIVRRHAALRTTFALRDGRPVQVVGRHRPLELPVRDLSGLPELEREREVERLVADAGGRPFDLVAGPLFEATLLRLGAAEHVLAIRTHHAVFDDWSVGIFRRELAALYSTHAGAGAPPLPEPKLSFADFSRRQRQRLAGPAGTRQLSFWRRELDGAPFTTQLPVDDPGRPEGSPQVAGDPVSLVLPQDVHARLRALAARERVTLFMTVLTAFGILVHRYTGQEDLLLATVVANRNRTELEDLIGCFTKKVPLRLRLHGDPTFAEALARTREALLGALSNQDLPFEGVVQDVLGGPAASHGLVPQAVLMFQGVTPRQELSLPGLETEGLETSAGARRAHFMAAADDEPAGTPGGPPWGDGLYLGTFLILSLTERPDELSFVARGAFHRPAVEELMESFRTLLLDVSRDPTRRVSELQILGRQGAAGVLRGARGRPAQPPPDNLLGAFAAQVERLPDALAVDARGEAVTYAELDARSDRLAERLSAIGAKRGVRIGIALRPSPQLPAAALAVWKTGAAWVGLDSADSADRLEWIVRDAGLEIVVGDPGTAPLPGHVREVAPGGEGELEAVSGGAQAPSGPDDAAVVFYGAGPAAIGRGVVLDHGAVLNLVTGLDEALQPRSAGRRRVLLSASPAHDGFLRQLAFLLAGHCLFVADHTLGEDPRRTASLVGSGAVDLLDCRVEELGALVDSGLGEALAEAARKGAQPVLFAATRAPVGPELWRTLRGLPGGRAHALYGPPECAFAATVKAAAEAPDLRGVGPAIAGVECHVLDPLGRPVPLRAVGELHLGGASLAREYLGDPEGSGERFVEHTLGGAPTRLHRSGQLARLLPDGGVELLGPLGAGDDLRGFRIQPTRIQAALAGCPGVREARVSLEPDEHGDPQVVADVVPDGEPPTLDRLRKFLWSRLPGYAWPSALRVVGRPRAAGAARDVPAGGAQTDASAEASALAALWAEVICIERVPPAANYWQVFSFLEALARAREAGVPVPGELVTANRTIETLAAALAAGRDGG